MSLINQVLQDLEKRNASGPELGVLSPHVRPMAAAPRRGFPALPAMLVVVAIVASAGALYFWNSSGALTPAVRPPAVSVAALPKSGATATVSREAVLAAAPVLARLPAPASQLSRELSFVPMQSPPGEPGEKDMLAADSAAALNLAAPRAIASVPAAPATAAASVAPKPEAAAAAPASAQPPAPVQEAAAAGAIDKQMREMPPEEHVELAFRKAVAALQEGRVSAAEAGFRDVLKEDPHHIAARQSLLGLLLDSGRKAEAEALLRHALEQNPGQPRHAMVLARLKVERGELAGAINTLVATLPYVGSDPDYVAFLAALLQRESRHREAVDYYRVALQAVPGNAVWMLGMGVSLRANNQIDEAREMFQRAARSRQLNPELQAFVEGQLRELSAAR